MTQFPGCVSFKVSDTPATVLHPGCTVKMSNLKSEAGKAVNGKEGVLGTFDAASERWVVKALLKMVLLPKWRDAVRVRPYALHWLEEVAKARCAPSGEQRSRDREAFEADLATVVG